MDYLYDYFVSLFPAGFDLNDMFWTMLFIFGIVIMSAVVIRFIFKQASGYLHALSSAMAILFFYLSNIMFYQHAPEFIGRVLELLPLIEVGADSVSLYTFHFTVENIPTICSEFLHILVFSMILITLDDLIPDAKNTFGWILLQFFLVILTCIVYRAFLELVGMIEQDFLVDYAPIILVCVLFTFVLLGLLKIILTLILATVSPLLGAVGTWFIGSKFGRVLGKSVLCSFLLCIIFGFLEGMGLTSIAFAEASSFVYSLYLLLLLILWVITGHYL